MASELEKTRLANIARNQRMLDELRLQELSAAAFDAPKKPAKPARSAPSRTRSKPPVEDLPRRKSRRLEGIKVEEPHDEYKVKMEEIELKKQDERARREGELQLRELVGSGNWDQALQVLSNLGDARASLGDYFDTTPPTDKTLAARREELSRLEADGRDIRLTQERIFSMAYHPSTHANIVIAGDKMGELGIWDASKPDDDGVLSFKAHTRAIAAIAVDPEHTNLIYTGSYDGSIRKLDLPKGASTEVFVYDSDPRDPVGISDFHLLNQNTIYYTTLTGEFGIVDMRDKAKNRVPVVLHEKKIGGFAVNPRATYQIATASLDRTLKVWDIRKPSPHLYAEYGSRLSVSCASWNSAGQVVCNGYDDTINIFDLDSAQWDITTADLELTPSVRIKHNCQSGRWVSILKSHWQRNPQDGCQKFVIANMKRYIDVYAGNGTQLAHLDTDDLTAVPAVVQFHPTLNRVVGGTASGKVYLFT